LERDYPLLLKKPESSLSKDDVYQIWLKLAQWFWKKRFLNFKNFQIIFTLSLLSPLGEGLSPFFEQTHIPFTQG
jgi:hypothetical protein